MVVGFQDDEGDRVVFFWAAYGGSACAALLLNKETKATKKATAPIRAASSQNKLFTTQFLYDLHLNSQNEISLGYPTK